VNTRDRERAIGLKARAVSRTMTMLTREQVESMIDIVAEALEVDTGIMSEARFEQAVVTVMEKLAATHDDIEVEIYHMPGRTLAWMGPMDALVEANQDLSPDELEALRGLRPGQEVMVGGQDCTPEFMVRKRYRR
jgi:hypothetical protein